MGEIPFDKSSDYKKNISSWMDPRKIEIGGYYIYNYFPRKGFQ